MSLFHTAREVVVDIVWCL